VLSSFPIILALLMVGLSPSLLGSELGLFPLGDRDGVRGGFQNEGERQQSVTLPVIFEGLPAAQGEDPRPVAGFVARAKGYTVRFTGREVAAFPGRNASGAEPLRISFPDSRPEAEWEGEGEPVSYSRYFRGNRAEQWSLRVPAFRGARLRNLYPGIDLVFYGKGPLIEYDFVVAPGADPEAIRIRFDGANAGISPEGDLLIPVASGVWMHRKPLVFEQRDGGLAAIPGRYIERQDGTIGFESAGRNLSASLIIDPVISFASFLGGSEYDEALSVAVDSAGSAFVAGVTMGIDFPGAAPTAGTRGLEIFITKLNPTGTGILYTVYLGGTGDDVPAGIALDNSGNVYLAGSTGSADFPVTAGAAQPTYRCCGGDAFVAKLSGANGAMLYSTYLGGAGRDTARAIAVGPDGSAFIAGETESADFPVTSGALQNSYGGGGADAFVTKVNPAGTAFSYSTYLGGNRFDGARGIAVNASGEAYVAGTTGSPNFRVTAGALRSTLPGPTGAFVSRLNTAGTALLYGSYWGSSGEDTGDGIALGAGGQIVLAGSTQSADLPVTAAAAQTTYTGETAGYAVRFAPAGFPVQFASYLPFRPAAVLADAGGHVFLTGTAAGGLPSTPDAFAPIPARGIHGNEAVLAQLAPAGDAFLYATYLGGRSEERGAALAAGPNNTVYVAGLTRSIDFPSSPGAAQALPGAPAGPFTVDGFIAKFDFSKMAAPLELSRNALVFLHRTGAQAVSPQTVRLSSNEPLTYRIQGPSWLRITPSSGTLESFAAAAFKDVQFQAEPANLAPGEYEGEAVLVSHGAANGRRAIPVRLVITAEAGVLRVEPATLTFTARTNNPAPAPQILRVKDPFGDGASGFPYTAAAQSGEGGWLQVSPNTGFTEGSVTVSVNPAGLAAGQYRGIVTIAAPDLGASSMVEVVLDLDQPRDLETQLFVQEDASRAVSAWYLSGNSVISTVAMSGPAPGWRLAASGDFDGNGVRDLIWQNDTSGQATIWYMGGANGSSLLAWAWIPDAGPEWRIVAAQDFDGDRVPDLVWQNQQTRVATVWYMKVVNGAPAMRQWASLAGPQPGWRIAGVCVPNLAGEIPSELALIWQNDTSGNLTAWIMRPESEPRNSQLMSWWPLANGSGSNWRVVGTPSRPGSGPALVWQDETTRQITLWQMPGLQVSGWAPLNPATTPGARVIAR
jgi:hypothetical protein